MALPRRDPTIKRKKASDLRQRARKYLGREEDSGSLYVGTAPDSEWLSKKRAKKKAKSDVSE